MLNLACLESATVSGDAPEGGREIPAVILWDSSTNDWGTELDLRKNDMTYSDNIATIKDDPSCWAATCSYVKNRSCELVCKDL